MVIDDTIVAISTAAGISARAIVRLSGPDAIRIAGSVLTIPTGRIENMGGFRTRDGIIRLSAGGIEIPCGVYLFRSPRSYTRQDVVELHLPGSPVIATSVTEALISAGARPAEPGEFTARAFFSGRIDLSSAEAVADVINAADDAQLRSATAAAGGKVHRLCAESASTTADILATVEATIDLADQDITLEMPSVAAHRLEDLSERLLDLAETAADTPDTADRPTAVITGLPNVGKSSLLNALTATDRAIVSAVAGTTRDVLSASMSLPGGCAIVLKDAAGFTGGADSLDEATDSAAYGAVGAADAVLFVTDLSDPHPQAETELLERLNRANPTAPLLLAANKIDLIDQKHLRQRLLQLTQYLPAPPSADAPEPTAISCTTGLGLDKLRHALGKCLHLRATRSPAAMGLHARQKRSLRAAGEAAGRAGTLIAGADTIADVAELAAVELRTTLAELGQISGQVVTEDILGRIFSRFCVGK